jgi:hypothetical protein
MAVQALLSVVWIAVCEERGAEEMEGMKRAHISARAGKMVLV